MSVTTVTHNSVTIFANIERLLVSPEAVKNTKKKETAENSISHTISVALSTPMIEMELVNGSLQCLLNKIGAMISPDRAGVRLLVKVLVR